MNITNLSHSLFTPFGGFSLGRGLIGCADALDISEQLTAYNTNDSTHINVTINDEIIFIQSPLGSNYYESIWSAYLTDYLSLIDDTHDQLHIKPILVSFIAGKLLPFTDWDMMITINNNTAKDCRVFSNQCSVEGLNTQAGYSVFCIFINEQTIIIENIIDSEFYNGCQVTFYNLNGGSGVTIISAIVNNVSTDGVNTYITFKNPVTNHTSGYVALNADYQAHSEGTNTIASGRNSHASGYGSIAELPSKVAVSDNCFNTPGDGQYSFTSVSAITIDATPVIMMVNGKFLKIRNNISCMFMLVIGGRSIDGTNNVLFLRYGIIKNLDNVLSLVGDVVTLGTDFNDPAWTIIVTADDTNKALNISVAGDDSSIVHWKSRCDMIEIG